MAKELTDDELNLRRNARRRLIGAAALTLAVVVILPMVLEGQPKPTGQDIELRIPAPDKAGEFVPGVVISAVAQAPSLAESAPSSTMPVVEPALVAPEMRPADAPAQPAAIPQPAATKTEEKPVAADGYAVQVGAYSNAKTAKQEFDKLKGWGFKAYTEKAGDKVRVRVGPYAEREKAEKVRQMIEKHGLHPVIVTIK